MKRHLILILSFIMAFAMNVSASITPTSSQMWWGYFSDSDVSSLPLSDGYLGYNQAAAIDAAIYVPANDEFVGPSTIKAVRFWLGNGVSLINSDLKVWISTTRPTDISASEYVQTVPQSSIVQGENDVELTTPFEVSNRGIYVGFSFSISGKAYPVMGGGTEVANAFFYRVDAGSWNNFYGYDYGNLALQLLIDGGNYRTNSVTADDFEQTVVLNSETSAKISVPLKNTGSNAVTSISYTVSTDGGAASAETTVSGLNLTFNQATDLTISLPMDKQTKKYKKTITVTKVNGESNNATDKSGSGNLIVLSESAVAVPVVEEFTGTWCGYCPYGIVGMQMARETYGDKAVLIAVHSGDIMAISGYSPIYSGVGSFPSAYMNRSVDFYPSYYYILNQIEAALKNTVQGSIALAASWTDETKTAVKFDTKTSFLYDDDNAQYGIAYALIEDGLTGTGSSWQQTNYLSGGSGNSYMSFWYSASYYVSGLEFDHVAVEAWDIKDGVSGSIGSSFRAGETLEYSYTGSITSASLSLIQDKTKVRAVALLIDRSTGKIVNAAQADISESTGIIIPMAPDVYEVGRYTVNGMKISAPQKGLNIIKMSDGSVVKELVE